MNISIHCCCWIQWSRPRWRHGNQGTLQGPLNGMYNRQASNSQLLSYTCRPNAQCATHLSPVHTSCKYECDTNFYVTNSKQIIINSRLVLNPCEIFAVKTALGLISQRVMTCPRRYKNRMARPKLLVLTQNKTSPKLSEIHPCGAKICFVFAFAGNMNRALPASILSAGIKIVAENKHKRFDSQNDLHYIVWRCLPVFYPVNQWQV